MKNAKRALSLLLSLMIVFGAVAVGGMIASAAYLSGSGTQDDPYKIVNYEQLREFASRVNSSGTDAWAMLLRDIDASDSQWTPIAGDSGHKYTGTFDGNGHKITGLAFDNSSSDFAGLFGYIGSEGTVRNVCLKGGSIRGRNYAGGIAGYNEGVVTNCFNTGAVAGADYVGGVVGSNTGTVTNCYNTGNVAGGSYVGGIAGRNGGTVTTCYNTGNVAGSSCVGGVAGYTNNGILQSCYNTGNVTGIDSSVGGVAGLNYGTAVNCFYDKNTCHTGKAMGNADDTETVKGVPTSRMTGADTFENMPGFTDDNWLVKENDEFNLYYPHLKGFNLNDGSQIPAEKIGRADWPARTVKDNVCEISDYDELKAFAAAVNAGSCSLKGILTADITASGNDWIPIGDNYDHGYTGTFDGAGHVITGLTTSEDVGTGGLFGRVENGGIVRNVGLKRGSIADGSFAGGVAGDNSGTITNCYNMSDVSGGKAGGVVGKNNGTVTNCYNTGAVSGHDYAGGVVGDTNGTVTNCYNTGDVSGADFVGGVAGETFYGSSVSDCYNTGAVTATGNRVYVGGVAGYSMGTVTICSNTGDVTAISPDSFPEFVYAGGVIGNNGGIITNCYNTGDVTAAEMINNTIYVGGVAGFNESEFEDNGIQNCYSAGKVTGAGFFDGGVCGYSSFRNPVENCYYDKTVCEDLGAVNRADDTGNNVFGLTTEEMTGSAAAVNMPGLFNADGSSDYWSVTSSYPRFVIEISDYDQLKAFAERVNRGETGLCAKLTNDIDASASAQENDWPTIANGLEGNDSIKYTGTFDGNGYVITGLYLNGVQYAGSVTNHNYTGLFGYIGEGGIVKNVGLEGGNIIGDAKVGSVAGYNEGLIINCYNTGEVSGIAVYVGGIAGNNNGTVSDCYNTGEISGKYTGGVAGGNTGTVTNCYNTGDVTGMFYAGGVVGENYTYYYTNHDEGTTELVAGTVENCYNTGNVTKTEASDRYCAGGVVGKNEGTVTTCYNTGDVSGKFTTGGVVGINNEGTVENCFYDKNFCHTEKAIGNADDTETVIGVPTSRMTGADALEKMDGFSDESWLVKANADNCRFYPHLKGFAYDDSGAVEDWPAKLVCYFWVGGNPVTNLNMDALHELEGINAAGGGSVIFVPDDDDKGGTLYLTDATITGSSEHTGDNSVVFSANIAVDNPGFDLTISLSGENKLTGDADGGIWVTSSSGLTVTGGGSLDIATTDSGIICGDLTIDTATVTIISTGGGCGILSAETSIIDSTVSAECTLSDGFGIVCTGDLIIDGSTVDATGAINGIYIENMQTNAGMTVSGLSRVTINSCSEYGAVISNGGFTFNDNNEIITPQEYLFDNYSVYNKNGSIAATVVIAPVCTVRFKNFDGSELQSVKILKGDSPEYTGGTPERTDPSGQFIYTFLGWDDGSGNICGADGVFPAASDDITYTAAYTPASCITATVNANEVVRGEKLIWNITTPTYVTYIRFTGTDENGNTYTEYYKYSNYNKGTTEVTVTDTGDTRVWNIPMTFNYPGSKDIDNQTWKIDFRRSGSAEWFTILNPETESAQTFAVKVGKNAAVLAPAPEGAQYAPYSIIGARYAVVNEDGADYVYFIVQTTDDVSKIKVSFVNETTGKTKTATYQTTSTNVKSHVSAGGTSVWVVRMKLTAPAANDEYTIQCRGSSWGEGTLAVRSNPTDD